MHAFAFHQKSPDLDFVFADDIVDDKATTTAALRESQDWQKEKE
jgi:hypothetical protein